MGEGSSETAAYLIGSLSKPVTSFAILNLADQEEINIDDAIEDFVSDFEYSGMDETSITIHHLLNHLSGISPSDSFSVTDTVREPENAIAEAIQELSGVTLVSEPGENYAYNSVNYLLLGGLIESMSSMSFADYLDSEVFEPLEMTNSSADWEGIEDDLVTAHVSWFGNPVSTDAFYDHAGAPYGYIASTTEDLSKFLSTVLFDDSSDEIFEGEGGDNYVNGWFYNDEGDYYHGGSTPEYRSQMMFNEDDGFGLVLLTNKYNFTEDGQVTEIVDGIGSILKGEPYGFSPGSNSYMQWGLLVAFVIIAVLMLID